MKKGIRIALQIILWVALWFIMASGHNDISDFLVKNWIIFLIQIIIITSITLYISSNYSIKNKAYQYIGIGVVTIIICGILSYQLSFSKDRHLPPPPQQSVHPTPDQSIGPPPHPNNGIQRLDPPPRLGRILNSPFLINFLILIITVTLASIIEVLIYAKRKEEALMHSKTQNLETELKLLKSQINPHFLFNALNNIYALSAIDATKTQQSINHLSLMLRYVLYECERPYVTISKEIDYIKNYITLYQLKSSKNYPIETQLDISNPSLKVSPMLLIPFIENAFKHSNIESLENTYLKISLTTEENKIVFKVKNTYTASRVKKDEVGGIGIENVKKRLNILYPSNHKFEISKDSGTFNILLEITVDA